ncbi:MAG: response regulator [Oscillospiraceae bacterium]|nr:response regulator [Oscillospiraceae bacterium]
MRVLLIEDEIAHCEKYEKCANHLPYEVELSVANGLKKAIKLAESKTFDMVFLDLELNEGDGDGNSFLRWLRAARLKKVPFIIVITYNSSHITHSIVRSLGADYIFMKVKPDYSPRKVFDFAYNCMLCQLKTEENQESFEHVIKREVEKMGFTYAVSGKEYLIKAIATVIYAGKSNPSLKKDVYPVVAKEFKKNEWSIERAIRSAIYRTWRLTDVETLYESYTDYVCYDTGVPTNKELILHIANKLMKGYQEFK